MYRQILLQIGSKHKEIEFFFLSERVSIFIDIDI